MEFELIFSEICIACFEKCRRTRVCDIIECGVSILTFDVGKGGKNYKKGKKRDEGETRRDLLFKEDGQGDDLSMFVAVMVNCGFA